jgi:hypothetical protein
MNHPSNASHRNYVGFHAAALSAARLFEMELAMIRRTLLALFLPCVGCGFSVAPQLDAGVSDAASNHPEAAHSDSQTPRDATDASIDSSRLDSSPDAIGVDASADANADAADEELGTVHPGG